MPREPRPTEFPYFQFENVRKSSEKNWGEGVQQFVERNAIKKKGHRPDELSRLPRKETIAGKETSERKKKKGA